jgi:hypothetical protein
MREVDPRIPDRWPCQARPWRYLVFIPSPLAGEEHSYCVMRTTVNSPARIRAGSLSVMTATGSSP